MFSETLNTVCVEDYDNSFEGDIFELLGYIPTASVKLSVVPAGKTAS